MSRPLILTALFLAIAVAPTSPLAEPTPLAAPIDQGQMLLAQAPTQPRGRVRIQGRDREEPVPLPAPVGLQVDIRQQMRTFIQSISTFARRYNRDFSIITHGALELLIKRDVVDSTRISPARTYMRSIDGVMVDGLFFGDKIFGEPIADEFRARNLRLTDMARDNGLSVFVMDFATDRKTIDESNRLNRDRGYISTAVHAPLAELGSLPPYPPRPFGENSKSILSMKDVSTFAYITNSAAIGRETEFVMKMHETNHDLLIVDVLNGRKPLSKRAVETLKYKKIGTKRLVYAIANIGTAASFQYYWKPTWREGSPGWVNAPVRGDPDRYHVQFWRPEWQRIITGDTKSYIYGLVALGFDGVILEGMEEAYRFLETGGEEQEETPAATTTAPAPAPTPAPTAPR
ncbi:MAG: hypothetical protein HQ494_01965 [Rhodospirillales bacterium]|nr:hypothetical protein [Rhodospirillales bacterium]